MSHADTLRAFASGPHPGLSYTGVVALIAGVEALEAIDRVRHALAEIDRLDDDAWAVWKHDADMYEQGRSDAYDHAHTIITEALGDTP